MLGVAVCLGADVRNCACDPAKPESMAARECGLCREAESQPADVAVFFLKDINPRKPNRWLALPRAHAHAFDDMTAEARTALWNASKNLQKTSEKCGFSPARGEATFRRGSDRRV